VEEFKGKLNTVLSSLGARLNEVIGSAEKHTRATKEHLDTLLPLLRKTEKENEELQEGYHRKLVDLAIQPILKVRDEVGLILSDDASSTCEESRSLLRHFDREMVDALHQLSIDEIPMEVGQEASGIESHLWEDLGAAVPTEEKDLHGCFASIRRKGYVLRGATHDGKTHVVRKAPASQYRFPSPQTGNDPQESKREPGTKTSNNHHKESE
jgi:hypothetical protein